MSSFQSLNDTNGKLLLKLLKVLSDKKFTRVLACNLFHPALYYSIKEFDDDNRNR